MNEMMKECFKPHVLMHSLFGLGLGLFLVYLFPALNIVWLGPLLMVISIVLDVMRKPAK
ncbi:hypothetical protein HYT02_04380 [Candidatus Gottesmanbacteria bacterium]|nr:hypothetical protein [Candidatus Gottesmanbacteria bacterium]